AFGEAVKREPDRAPWRRRLGLALERQGRLPEARAAFQQALDLDPSDLPSWVGLASVARRQADWETEAQACARAITLRPGAAHLYADLGAAFEAQGLERKPGGASLRRGLGMSLYFQGRYEMAERAFRDAVLHNPAYARAWADLGELLSEQGRLPESAVAFREAIRVKEQRIASYRGLGRVLLAQGLHLDALVRRRTS